MVAELNFPAAVAAPSPALSTLVLVFAENNEAQGFGSAIAEAIRRGSGDGGVPVGVGLGIRGIKNPDSRKSKEIRQAENVSSVVPRSSPPEHGEGSALVGGIRFPILEGGSCN